jgi:hypothetical protein
MNEVTIMKGNTYSDRFKNIVQDEYDDTSGNADISEYKTVPYVIYPDNTVYFFFTDNTLFINKTQGAGEEELLDEIISKYFKGIRAKPIINFDYDSFAIEVTDRGLVEFLKKRPEKSLPF